MKLVVDGKAWPVPIGANKVMDVIGEVLEQLNREGRGLVGVLVNGESVQPGDIQSRWCEKPLDADMEIEVTSQSIAELVNQSLAELEKWLPELPRACSMLARVFQGDDAESGFQYFHEFARLWSEIKRQEQQVVNTLGLDLTTVEVDGKPLSALHETLNARLQEALVALEKRDFVLLGDLLEYELTPFAALEAKIVTALSEANRRSGTNHS